MKIEYDCDVDTAFIYFKDIEEGEVMQTISLNDSVNIDLDADGRTLGIEIIDASKNLPKNAINSEVIIN